jgi:uncharacterized protein YndB with AHSA1/START domain
MPDILLTREYPHPPKAVWNFLTDPELIATWLMPNNFKPEEGHLFEMRTTPRRGFDGIIRCRVLSLNPPRVMKWSWQSGTLDSIVTFDLKATQTGTLLTLHHTGFNGLAGIPAWFFMRAGWKSRKRQPGSRKEDLQTKNSPL